MKLEQFLKPAISEEKIIFNINIKIPTSFVVLGDDGRFLRVPLPRLSNLVLEEGDEYNDLTNKYILILLEILVFLLLL